MPNPKGLLLAALLALEPFFRLVDDAWWRRPGCSHCFRNFLQAGSRLKKYVGDLSTGVAEAWSAGSSARGEHRSQFSHASRLVLEPQFGIPLITIARTSVSGEDCSMRLYNQDACGAFGRYPRHSTFPANRSNAMMNECGAPQVFRALGGKSARPRLGESLRPRLQHDGDRGTSAPRNAPHGLLRWKRTKYRPGCIPDGPIKRAVRIRSAGDKELASIGRPGRGGEGEFSFT